MNKKQWLGLGLVTVAAIGLAACGNRASKKDSKLRIKNRFESCYHYRYRWVDDKSFNQSVWEGLQAWVKKRSF